MIKIFLLIYLTLFVVTSTTMYVKLGQYHTVNRLSGSLVAGAIWPIILFVVVAEV